MISRLLFMVLAALSSFNVHAINGYPDTAPPYCQIAVGTRIYFQAPGDGAVRIRAHCVDASYNPGYTTACLAGLYGESVCTSTSRGYYGSVPAGVNPCPAPKVMDPITGICGAPTVCQSTVGQVATQGMIDLGTDENALPPADSCDGACVVSYNGGGVVARQIVNGAYHYFSQGSYTRTSASCTVSDMPSGTATLPPASCDPDTQDQGTINGSFTCLDRSTTKTTTTAPPVTNPDGSTTETTTTTDSATGTDTVTTKTTGADGSVTETTTTQPTPGSPGDSSDFCKENPSDPTCSKDDIPWGTIPEAGVIPTFEVPITTAYEVIGGEGSCPADASVSFMGTALTWSYAPICTFAEMIRPLVLGFAWLSFGFIIVGGLGRAR